MAVYLGSEKVSSGGGIGGGSTGGGVETFKITFYNYNISGTVIASTKTFSELKDAIENGKVIEAERKQSLNDVNADKLWLTMICSDDNSEINGFVFYSLDYGGGKVHLYEFYFSSDESITKTNIKLAVVSQ